MPSPKCDSLFTFSHSAGEWVTLLSGHRLFARFWPASHAEAVVICLHGAESHSGWFDLVAKELNSIGLDVLAYDRNGWGMSDGRKGHADTIGEIYDEFSSLLFMLRSQYSRVHLLGMSWGGLLGLYFSHWIGHLCSSMTIVSPAIFLKNCLSIKFDLNRLFGSLKSKNFNFPLPFSGVDFSEVQPIQKRIDDDPLRVTQVSMTFLRTTLLAQSFVRSIIWKKSSTPLTILLGDTDAIVDIDRIKRFCANKTLSTVDIKGGHSLVFDNPVGVSNQIKFADRFVINPK